MSKQSVQTSKREYDSESIACNNIEHGAQKSRGEETGRGGLFLREVGEANLVRREVKRRVDALEERVTEDPSVDANVGTDDRADAAVRSRADPAQVERARRDGPLLGKGAAEREGNGGRARAGIGPVTSRSVRGRIGDRSPELLSSRRRSLVVETQKCRR